MLRNKIIFLLPLFLITLSMGVAEDFLEDGLVRKPAAPQEDGFSIDNGLERERAIPYDESTFDPVSGLDFSKGFKYAWNLPKYQAHYANLSRARWLEPSNLFFLNLSFTHRREHDNQDNYQMLGYASFRPFAYDFGNASIAFGVSYISRAIHVSDFNPKIQNQIVNGNAAVVTAKQIRSQAYQQAINFSALASFPEVGLQIIFDVGVGTSTIRQTIDPITADVGGLDLVVLTIDEYQYEQKDTGMFFGINFLKNFDREYFNYMRLFFYGAHRVDTNKRDSTGVLNFRDDINNVNLDFGKQDLEGDFDTGIPGLIFPDPQQVDVYKLDFLAMQFEMQFYTWMTPLSDTQGISFSSFFSVIYSEGELLGEDFYGMRYRYGGVIGLFGGVSVRISYVDEEHNDRVDGFEATLSVKVSELVRTVMN